MRLTEAAQRRVRTISAEVESPASHRVHLFLRERVGSEWEELRGVLDGMLDNRPPMSPTRWGMPFSPHKKRSSSGVGESHPSPWEAAQGEKKLARGGEGGEGKASSMSFSVFVLSEEMVVASATCALLATEACALECLRSIEALEERHKSWSKLASRPMRLSIAQIVNMSDYAHEVLVCDRKVLQAQECQSSLLRCLGVIRRGVGDLENATDLQGLSRATHSLLALLQSLIRGRTLEDFRLAGGAGVEGEEVEPSALVRAGLGVVSELAEGSGFEGLRGLVSKLDGPPMLYRVAPRMVAACVGTVALLGSLRPKGIADWIKVGVGIGQTLRESAVVFYKEHMAEPFLGIYQELFVTSKEAYEWREQARVSKESLKRMLTAFVKDKGLDKAAKAVAEGGEAAVQGAVGEAVAAAANTLVRHQSSIQDMQMETVVRLYEEQMASPVKNMIMGDMLQSLLIQMHFMKAHMEEEAAAVHTLIKSNQINMQMMAAVPAVLFVFGVFNLVTTTIRWSLRHPTHPKQHFREVLRDVHRIMIAGPQSASQAHLDEHMGRLLLHISALCKTKPRMMLSHKSSCQLESDLLLLRRCDISTERRLALVESMLRGLPGLI